LHEKAQVDPLVRYVIEEVHDAERECSFSTLLSCYFSKVVICLMLQNITSLMNYVQEHMEFIVQLVGLIGITLIMEMLIHLIGVDETIYSNCANTQCTG
jgi:serine/threonine-protein phosphatase 6 regulatory subunit 3